MNLKEYLLLTHYTKPLFNNMRPTLICKDGFKMSVQAGSGYHCEPREETTKYTSVEIGFPNYDDILAVFQCGSLEQYEAERSYYLKDPLDGIIERIPAEIIQKVIDKHGGIDDQKLFDRIEKATKHNQTPDKCTY
jgi:hypothetical protein